MVSSRETACGLVAVLTVPLWGPAVALWRGVRSPDVWAALGGLLGFVLVVGSAIVGIVAWCQAFANNDDGIPLVADPAARRAWLIVAIVCSAPWALAIAGGLVAWILAPACTALVTYAFQRGVEVASAERVAPADAGGAADSVADADADKPGVVEQV